MNLIADLEALIARAAPGVIEHLHAALQAEQAKLAADLANAKTHIEGAIGKLPQEIQDAWAKVKAAL